MSYKHLNFKCILLKYHTFSCFDPVFTVEISCFESVKSTQLSHTNQPVGFSGGSEGKASACNAGELGLIPELGRSPGKGNGNSFQYSCLGNPTDRAADRKSVV